MFSRIFKALMPAANAVVSVVAPLGAFIFFTRLANPAEVGVIATSIAWIEVLKVITPMGLYEAVLMHDNEDGASAVAGLLGVSAMVAALIYVGITLASPLWLGATAQAILPLTLTLVAKLIFDVICIQPWSLLARRRDYHRMTMRGMTGLLGAVIIGLLVAKLSTPLWGMVAYYISQSAIYWLLLVVGTKAMARPNLDLRSLKPLWSNAMIATQIRSVGTINNFFDQVMVSMFVPPAATANYNVGRRVELAELAASSTFISNIYQPMFARAETETLARNYRMAMISMVAIFGVPSIALAINSTSVVQVVFGTKWLTAAPMLQAFAISGFSRVIQNVQGAHFSVGKQNRLLRNRTLISAATGLAMVALTPWVGLLAVCWLITAKNIGVAVWSIGPARSLASWRFMAGAVLAPALGAGIGAYGGLVLMEKALPHHASVITHLATWAVSGILAYVGAALLALPHVKPAANQLMASFKAA